MPESPDTTPSKCTYSRPAQDSNASTPTLPFFSVFRSQMSHSAILGSFKPTLNPYLLCSPQLTPSTGQDLQNHLWVGINDQMRSLTWTVDSSPASARTTVISGMLPQGFTLAQNDHWERIRGVRPSFFDAWMIARWCPPEAATDYGGLVSQRRLHEHPISSDLSSWLANIFQHQTWPYTCQPFYESTSHVLNASLKKLPFLALKPHMQQSDVEDSPDSNNLYLPDVKDKSFKLHRLAARLLHLVQIKEPLQGFTVQIPTVAPTDPNKPSTSTALISQLSSILFCRYLPIWRKFISCHQLPFFTSNSDYPTSKKKCTASEGNSSNSAAILFSAPTKHNKPTSTVTSSRDGAVPVPRFFCGDAIAATHISTLEAENWHRMGCSPSRNDMRREVTSPIQRNAGLRKPKNWIVLLSLALSEFRSCHFLVLRKVVWPGYGSKPYSPSHHMAGAEERSSAHCNGTICICRYWPPLWIRSVWYATNTSNPATIGVRDR